MEQRQIVKRGKNTSGKSEAQFEPLRSLLHLWILEIHPDLERKGCPGRERLEVVVKARTKVKDKYTLDHIGQCAACLDEMRDIKREIGGICGARL
jgi:hypothetical protein